MTSTTYSFDLPQLSTLNRLAQFLVPAGRVLYAAIFLQAGIGHLVNAEALAGYATAAGVPLAGIAVPASGLLALLGALSVLLGYHARVGALLLVLFLVPVTLMMHPFWAVTDPARAPVEQAMFMKNLSMTGAALLIGWLGAGPVSLDARREALRQAS